DCGCTNCPLPIFSETTTSSSIDVIVDGPNDLGQCGLSQVCFEITHTWIGDLSVSLTSPSGLQYLVMADIDNTFNGCGNPANDANVCITLGTDNPITNNEEYVCNNPVPCLINDWTVPCGGVVDPETPAVQTPNCDLNDFNVPGDPANGTWTLTVSDICPLDVGSLDDWYLVFDCGTVECIQCEAAGGELNVSSIEACEGSADLIYTGMPTYASDPPDTANYNYVYLISQNDVILEADTMPDLTSYLPGIYSICGFSYLNTYEDSIPNLIGTEISVLYSELPFCSDLTDNCATVEVFGIPPLTQVDTTLCFGECFTAPDGTDYCDPGLVSYSLLNINGCDSLVEVNLSILPLNNTVDTVLLCAGETVTIGGSEYGVGDHTVILTAFTNCDSIVDLTVVEVLPEAMISSFGVISCVDQEITIDGSGSLGDTYSWIDENGVELGTDPSIDLNSGGNYSLVVSLPATNGVCLDTIEFTVQDTSALPVQPVLLSNTPSVLCEGQQYTFDVSAYPDVTSYNWTLPANATLISSNSDQSSITIEFTGPGLVDLCVTATNGCGEGAQACFGLDVTGLVLEPMIMGDLEVCPEVTATYCVTDDVEASVYTWTTTNGSIQNGQGTTCVEVQIPAGGTTLCVTSSNDCDQSMEQCINISTIPLVSDPVFVNSPSESCVGQEADFFL
ncbi:MAG: proprotein convertase P-domain-containing protein, partial [Bacteroidota bacterium]